MANPAVCNAPLALKRQNARLSKHAKKPEDERYENSRRARQQDRAPYPPI